LDAEGNPVYFRERDGDPFGGNLLVEATAELIFPMPFVDDNRQFRPVLFVDAGNVFNTDCPAVSINCFGFDADNFRYSVGVGVSWLSGMGPLTFSFAKPFQTQPFDEKEMFQFELGRTF
jgi:outer membrane protein insertion porin family